MTTRAKVWKAWQWGSWWVGVLLIFAGCGGNAQPAIVTVVPTATPTALPTLTQTHAAGFSWVTATSLPTALPLTATPGPSPTSPLAPTLSPAPATLTATRVPTRAGLSVEYFTTDSETARPGDTVTLFWSVRGANTARIFRLDADEERVEPGWDVRASGKLTVRTRPQDREVARFVLVAWVGEAEVQQVLLIPLQCGETWFFDPAPETCPAEPPQVSLEAEQTFEHGRMIWVQAQDRIYVIFDDGRTPAWARYPDNFEEGDPERDDSVIPPPSLLQPVRGFGLVWRSNERVRDRLGWATSPEVAFDGMFQSDSPEPSVATFYVRTRDGDILALDAQTQTWDVLPAAP